MSKWKNNTGTSIPRWTFTKKDAVNWDLVWTKQASSSAKTIKSLGIEQIYYTLRNWHPWLSMVLMHGTNKIIFSWIFMNNSESVDPDVHGRNPVLGLGKKVVRSSENVIDNCNFGNFGQPIFWCREQKQGFLDWIYVLLLKICWFWFLSAPETWTLVECVSPLVLSMLSPHKLLWKTTTIQAKWFLTSPRYQKWQSFS